MPRQQKCRVWLQPGSFGLPHSSREKEALPNIALPVIGHAASNQKPRSFIRPRISWANDTTLLYSCLRTLFTSCRYRDRHRRVT